MLNGLYSINKNIGFKTPMLRSDLCDHSDVYIAVKSAIDLLVTAASKITNILIDSAKYFEIVIPMNNL